LGLTAALLLYAPTGALAAPETPESTLRLLQVNDAQDEPQVVLDGGTLPRSAEVIFEVSARSGGDYLYLLQRRAEGLHVLLPGNGLVWMKPSGLSRVAPRAPEASATGEASKTWNADQTGELEFILVAATAPRDIPSDGHIPSLQLFLMPPPFVRGAVAETATVLARSRVLWLEDDPD
jgi:hypothetical protein